MNKNPSKNSVDYLFDSVMGREALAIAMPAVDEDPDMPPDQVRLRVAYDLGYDTDRGCYEERPGSFWVAKIAADYAITSLYETDLMVSES